MIIINIIHSYRDVVAVCDSELLGKRFEEGKFQLDLTGEFFKGEEYDEENVISIMEEFSREDATFNIVGKNSINAALRAGIIEKNGIKTIQGIPFALVLL
jgi:hypothetical protein